MFCVRNEKFRLEYFLNYYRQMGVTEFFAIDNGSDDGTKEYLLSQADTFVFFTQQSYKESNAGRDWTSSIAYEYCSQNWCLTLDVDEFLVFPHYEYASVDVLVSYFDRWGYQAAYGVFLDFYSDVPLSKTTYTSGQSVFDVCSYYDTSSSYRAFETPNFPFLQLKGGPRQRKFWDSKDPKSGPSMRKLVLAKWDDDFEYLHSTHSCTSVRLADITVAVTHFKFLAHLKDFSKAEVKRNDRVANSGDWRVYAQALDKEDVVLFDQGLSRRYHNSESLINDGHISSSIRFIDHLSPRALAQTDPVASAALTSMRERLFASGLEASISYRDLNKVWSSIGLFSQSFGSSTKNAQDLFRIDADINALINSAYWKSTRPLRKLAEKFGFCDYRSFPEDMLNQSVYTKFNYTIRSAWYELLAPVKLVVRVFKKVIPKRSS